MSHSKLPWKKKHHKILDQHGRLVADVRGACGFGEDKDNADLILAACNEHDALKAKAELLDKTVESLKCVSFPVRGRTFLEASMELAVIANTLIAKAKDLSK